jgi:hypothetical protein
LCHEPKVALAVLEAMVSPYSSSAQLEILYLHEAVDVTLKGDRLESVSLCSRTTGITICVTAAYILDATELGDLLDLARIEHVIGAESQAQTGEMHAADVANPLDQQAISWCFALDYLAGQDHTISQPKAFDFWRNYQADFWPDKHFSWYDVNPVTLKKRHLGLFESELAKKDGLERNLWTYRRVLCKDYYKKNTFESDISLVNWPQIDYWLGPIVGVSKQEKEKHLEACKQLSLSFLYWMQTEAPRHDGGTGYPELRLRKDLLDTEDGLAKAVYVRESRRIQAEFTVLEEHLGVEQRAKHKGAQQFKDSVGIGSYRIDLHPSSSGRNYIDVSSYPFQIPLGALIPKRIENVLPACKNIGVTHITNGCYRLHPVEWTIGEVAGALATYCLDKKLEASQLRNRQRYLEDFQSLLVKQFKIELEWPKAIRSLAR